MLPCQHELNACRGLDSQEFLGGGWRVAVDLPRCGLGDGCKQLLCYLGEEICVQANVEGRMCI